MSEFKFTCVQIMLVITCILSNKFTFSTKTLKKYSKDSGP